MKVLTSVSSSINSTTTDVEVPTKVEFDALAARVTKLETPISNVLLEDSFNTPYNFTGDNQVSPDGKWKVKYLSGGKTFVSNGVLTTYPAVATVSTTTYSTLVLSTKSFKNFQFDVDMKTNKQLRTPTPKSWETAWVFFRYTDELPRSVHHYYFLLKTDGYEFGKKDNAVGDTSPEKQIFIQTGPLPKAVVGTSYHITVKVIDYKFTISVNGVIVVDMVDPQIFDPVKMSQGLVGLYEEDAEGVFDNVKVIGL